MNRKSLSLLAALAAVGCAHQGGSARYESGSESSSSYSWRDVDVGDVNREVPTAQDYLNAGAGSYAEIDLNRSVAVQMDPAAAVHANDIDASAQASSERAEVYAGSEIGRSASADVASWDATADLYPQTRDTALSLQSQTADGGHADPETIGSDALLSSENQEIVTSSAELPGAEARQDGVPAAFAPLKDNHPDLTDAPGYPEEYAPNFDAAIGGSASGESGAASSSDNLEREPLDAQPDNDWTTKNGNIKTERHVIPPLTGVPSDGSSGHLNSGSSVGYSDPETGGVVTPTGRIETQDKANIGVEIIPPGVGTSSASEIGAMSASDRELSDRVYRELRSNQSSVAVDEMFRDVKITARDGNVTLKGSVESEQQKQMIEERVFRMDGVQSVENNLTIQGQE